MKRERERESKEQNRKDEKGLPAKFAAIKQSAAWEEDRIERLHIRAETRRSHVKFGGVPVRAAKGKKSGSGRRGRSRRRPSIVESWGSERGARRDSPKGEEGRRQYARRTRTRRLE